jgi:hypothetical protein
LREIFRVSVAARPPKTRYGEHGFTSKHSRRLPNAIEP